MTRPYLSPNNLQISGKAGLMPRRSRTWHRQKQRPLLSARALPALVEKASCITSRQVEATDLSYPPSGQTFYHSGCLALTATLRLNHFNFKIYKELLHKHDHNSREFWHVIYIYIFEMKTRHQMQLNTIWKTTHHKIDLNNYHKKHHKTYTKSCWNNKSHARIFQY